MQMRAITALKVPIPEVSVQPAQRGVANPGATDPMTMLLLFMQQTAEREERYRKEAAEREECGRRETAEREEHWRREAAAERKEIIERVIAEEEEKKGSLEACAAG